MSQLQNKKSIRKRIPIILLHVGLWMLYAAVQLAAAAVQTNNLLGLVYTSSCLFLMSASIFYINSEWLLPRTLEKNKTSLWIIGLVGLFAYYLGIRELFLETLYELVNGTPAPKYAPTVWILNNLWWWFQAVSLSTGYWFARVSIKKEKKISLQREELDRKRNEETRLKQEKLELEIAYLRAQINPHFLFNTLGYFYNKTANSQPDVAEGIAALTNIMRSSLKKRGPDGMVSLEEEIEHIESLISIYFMRFNNNIHVEYSRPDSLHGQRILPHILITLVENAFKHGELHSSAYPLKIKLNLDESGLYFYINNKKRIGPKEISNGIGMEYVQRQLENTYPNKYSFEIKDTDLFYSLSLHIATTEITLHDQLLYN